MKDCLTLLMGIVLAGAMQASLFYYLFTMA